METRRSGRKANFRSGRALEAIRAYADGSLTVARLLAAVGAISLVIGGIGIMNIMLVGVTERTREIGIRMAIGTRGTDILRQFMLEAVALSVLGGLAGVLVGCAVSWSITWLNQWPTQVTVGSVALALLFSTGIGVVFGYQPARRAASLVPVEALRTE
jgi:putative ABC transport system permease protein